MSARIGGHELGRFLDPYVIAEIGVNHEGSLELARRLIDEAAAGGAHAAKFQSYQAGKLASKESPAYWDLSQEPTRSQYALFKKYDAFGRSDYQALAAHCAESGIDFLSTPFDLDAVDMLRPLVPAFKIASADITNVPLLRKAAASGKPLLVSTGAASLEEIEQAVATARAAGADCIVLLHCVLNYPTPSERAQLGMIEVLRDRFADCLIGYSDHVVPDAALASLEAAALLGATVLEKHFTHDKTLPGNDHYHAMDRDDLSAFLDKLARYRTLYGTRGKNLEWEREAREHARRSIVAARAIEAGEILNEDNLIAKRPGHGISPARWDEVIGKRAARRIEEDRPLSWHDIA